MFDISKFDINKLAELGKTAGNVPKKIIIRSGVIVDAVWVEFADGNGYRIGGMGGGNHELILEEGEVITELCGRYSLYDSVKVVSYLKFTTNKGRILESHGGTAGKMDFSCCAESLFNIRGKDARNSRGAVYLGEICADKGIGMLAENK